SGILRSIDGGANWSSVPPLPEDLTISITASAGAVSSGEKLTLTITVRNLANRSAENVTVKHQLQQFMTFLSCTVLTGTCSESAGVVTANVGTLPAGSQSVVVITVTAPPTKSTYLVSGAVSVSTNSTGFSLPFNRALVDITVLSPIGAQPVGGPLGGR